jgi:tRNA 2-(methylsulfanyl)-N6-isopentenyladenosine37 hydroxylase
VRSREPERLVDTLLCCALIEARSCERFRLLSEAAADPRLRSLYAGLLASEARHHQVYVTLAGSVDPAVDVRARLDALALFEAQVLAQTPPMPRMHA